MRPITDFIPATPVADEEYPGRLPTGAGARRNLLAVLQRLEAEGSDPLQNHYLVDIQGSTPHFMLGVSPCLTRSRAGGGGHWISWRQRFMSAAEICALQGVSIRDLHRERLSDRQLCLIAGNAIPVPLLARVLRAALRAAGLRT